MSFDAAVNKAEDIISFAGCTTLSTDIDDKKDLVEQITRFLVLVRLREPVEQ
jgi:hypothetical protein